MLSSRLPVKPAPVLRPGPVARCMRLFFCDPSAREQRFTARLQQRALWIGLALVLSSLSECVLALNPSDALAWPRPLALLLPFVLTGGSFCLLGKSIALGSTGIGMRMQCEKKGWRCVSEHATRMRGWRRGGLGLMLFLAVIGGVFGCYVLWQCTLPPRFANDGTALDTNAAYALLAGRDPYGNSNILDVVQRFAMQPDWTTPLRNAEFARLLDYPGRAQLYAAFHQGLRTHQSLLFESQVSYPALAFLTLVPFALCKQNNVLLFYLLTYFVLLIVAWRAVLPALRPWLVLLVLANVPTWGLLSAGNLDIFNFLLLSLAWIQRRHAWMSALWLGLALATKQTSWLFVPFYLLMAWRCNGLRMAVGRGVLAVGIGLIINLPFIIWNPAAWLSGVLAPVADPMFPLGVGFVALSMAHLLPYLPYWVYLGLEGGALVAMLLYYWRICRCCPEAAFVLALVPIFFAWRSLPSYFACMPFTLFVMMAANATRTHCRRSNDVSAGRSDVSAEGR